MIKDTDMQYKIPGSGTYKVSAEIMIQRPTGKKLLISNPDWKWWKFWLPKQIEVSEMETVEKHEFSGSKVFNLGESQTIKMKR